MPNRMFKGKSFENSVHKYTLKFKDAALEERYKKSCANVLMYAKLKRFLLIAVLVFFIFVLLSEILLAVMSSNFEFNVLRRCVTFGIVIVIAILEVVFWKVERLAMLRTTAVSIVFTILLVNDSFRKYSELYPYPVVDIWYFFLISRVVSVYTSTFFLQVLIAATWLVTLASNIILTVALIILFFVQYAKTLLDLEGMDSFVSMSLGFVIYMLMNAVVCCAFSYIFEIRERRNFFNDAQIIEAKEIYKDLFDALPNPSVITSQGEIEMWNEALMELIDPSRLKEKLTLDMLSCITQRDGGESFADIISANRMLSECERQFKVSRGGEDLKLLIKSVEIARPGKKIMEYIIEDHTAVEDLEKAKAEQKCFYILLSTATHDFCTPLNGLNGLLEILTPKLTEMSCQAELKLAHNCIKRILFYLQGLRFLNNIVANNFHILENEVNVRRAVGETVQLLDYSIKAKKLVVEEMYNAIPEKLLIDKDKYQQILINILENAIKYSLEGAIKIRVKYNYSKEALSTSVEDNGIGIDEEDAKDLFKLFRRNHSTDALNPQGLGLGLYLAKKISKRLGGHIKVESKKGAGTKFTFHIRAAIKQELVTNSSSFNLLRADSESQLCKNDVEERKDEIVIPVLRNSTVHDLRPPSKAKCECARLLIVDDESLNIYVLLSFLKAEGLAADTALNGLEALKKIEERPCRKCGSWYEVILMDINMPVMDGIECTREIQRRVKKKLIPRVAVLAVTAAAHLDNAQKLEEYRRIGFQAVSKPLCKGSAKAGVQSPGHEEYHAVFEVA